MVNVRDGIGFLLFIAIICGTFYAIHENAGPMAYVCLMAISFIIQDSFHVCKFAFEQVRLLLLGQSH